jgi:hypothetical protein
MIEKLEQSSGNAIGFKISGTITKEDMDDFHRRSFLRPRSEILPDG